MKLLKSFIKSTPVLNKVAAIAYDYLFYRNIPKHFSSKYWDNRYKNGGNSGAGSYNRLAEFKAEFLNNFVKENAIKTVVEFGCGDGHQLSLSNYPSYVGYDISPTAVELCRLKFEKDKSKHFLIYNPNKKNLNEIINKFDLSISLDVLYHLVEDDIFKDYIETLFAASTQYVVIYSCNEDENTTPHVRKRKFTNFVEEKLKQWHLVDVVKNIYPYDPSSPDYTSFADFFIYKKLE